MCFFMFAITHNGVNESVLQKVEKGRLYVRDNSNLVTDRALDSFYYDINNGHCACEIVVSPFSKTDEVKEVLKDIYSMGSFKFLIADTDEEDIYEYMKKNAKFERMLSELGAGNISFEELMEIYPGRIDFNKLYLIEKS